MHQKRWLWVRPKAKSSRGKPFIRRVSQVLASFPQDLKAFGSSASARRAGSSVPEVSRNVVGLLTLALAQRGSFLSAVTWSTKI